MADLAADEPRKTGGRLSHMLVMLTSLAAGVAATVTVLDSWSKVLVDLGLREDRSFVLAEKNARGDVVRQIVHLVAERDFWTIRYADYVAQDYPSDDLADAWKHYGDSVVEWNGQYLVASTLVDEYFPGAPFILLKNINWAFRGLNKCLNLIQYRSLFEASDPVCHVSGFNGGDQNQNAAAAIKATEALDQQIGVFVAAIASHP